MAYESGVITASFISSIDLNTAAHLHMFVDLAGTNAFKITLAGSGGGMGVLQNKPQAGEHATIAIRGQVKANAGATITVGQFITAALSGYALGASEFPTNTGSAGTYITELVVLGQALTAAASGSVFTMELSPRFTQVVSA